MNFQETLFPGYTIGEDAYQNIPAVCAPFGKKAAIIGRQTRPGRGGGKNPPGGGGLGH